jgi:hypothetical protein
MDDLRPLSHAIISVLFVIALVTIPMRIWVRGFAMKSFGWDDWMMASMIVGATGVLRCGGTRC